MFHSNLFEKPRIVALFDLRIVFSNIRKIFVHEWISNRISNSLAFWYSNFGLNIRFSDLLFNIQIVLFETQNPLFEGRLFEISNYSPITI